MHTGLQWASDVRWHDGRLILRRMCNQLGVSPCAVDDNSSSQSDGCLICLILFTIAGAAAGATAESEPPAPPTKSTADEMSEMAKEQLAKIAKEMGMPVWALYCIGIGKSFSTFSLSFAFFFSTEKVTVSRSHALWCFSRAKRRPS